MAGNRPDERAHLPVGADFLTSRGGADFFLELYDSFHLAGEDICVIGAVPSRTARSAHRPVARKRQVVALICNLCV